MLGDITYRTESQENHPVRTARVNAAQFLLRI